MGIRFRKSVKIAPGVKVNFGKKSSSISFGGKGFHHTINSSGRRTATAGIPGTGISYSQSSGGSRRKTRTSSQPKKNNASGNSSGGCLTIILAFFAICLALLIYSYAWIPAIGFLIYFIIKKNIPNRNTKIIVSSVVIITSVLMCVWINTNDDMGPSTNQNADESKKQIEEDSVFQESLESQETDKFTIVNKFIELFNASAKNKIEDISEMNIHGEDYRTEFRLGAFDDAVGKKGKIAGSIIYIVNYGSLSNDSIRIYISSPSDEITMDIYVTTIHIFSDTVSDEEMLKALDSTSIFLESGHISGYVSGYDIMLDCDRINFTDV